MTIILEFWDWSSFLFVGVMVILQKKFPGMKARADIRLLLFTSILVLTLYVGYENGWTWLIQNWQRVLIISCITTILLCCFIWLVWFGEDLYNLVAANIHNLGDFF